MVDSNWYEASLGSRCGLVPKSYVEPLHDRLYVPLTLPLTTSTSFTDSPLHSKCGNFLFLFIFIIVVATIINLSKVCLHCW